MSVKEPKRNPNQITVNFHDIREKIINQLLCDSNNTIAGPIAVDRILKMRDENINDETNLVLSIFSEDSEKTKDQCTIFEIIPGLTVETENYLLKTPNSMDSADWYEVIFRICETDILYAHIFDASEKFEANRDNLYAHDYVYVSKFSNGLYNPGVMFDLPPSAKVFNSVLSEYQKGYISVAPPPPSNSFHCMKDRLHSNMVWYHRGWVTIHGILKEKTYGKITIGTTMQEIKKLDLNLYDKRFKDGKCPITLIDYSELKGIVVFTNTKIVCEFLGFGRYITSPNFNGLCPCTKLQLK